ncbi:hypothetical protein NDA15_005642 [Ustilago hordei]|nr:hypothetical protein NDA15_005642 [Ustilago hordei]
MTCYSPTSRNVQFATLCTEKQSPQFSNSASMLLPQPSVHDNQHWRAFPARNSTPNKPKLGLLRTATKKDPARNQTRIMVAKMQGLNTGHEGSDVLCADVLDMERSQIQRRILIGSWIWELGIFTGSEVLEATAVGDVSITTKYGDILLQNILYVKNLNINLLSTMSLTDEGAQVTLDHTGSQIHLANGIILKISKNSKCGLLEFQGDTWQENAMTVSTQPLEGVSKEFEPIVEKHGTSTQQLWHEHLGHPGRDKAKAITKRIGNDPTMQMDPDTALTCEQCIWSKSTIAWMGQGSGERSAAPLDLIHIDLIIDASHATEHTCILVLVDDHSRSLKVIWSDQGGEWKSNEALEWLQDKGNKWQTTVGQNSNQNGQVERMNRSLGEKMRALLMQRGLPKSFWPYAIRAAAFKMNLTPNVDNKLPYQAMFKKPLDWLI